MSMEQKIEEQVKGIHPPLETEPATMEIAKQAEEHVQEGDHMPTSVQKEVEKKQISELKEKIDEKIKNIPPVESLKNTQVGLTEKTEEKKTHRNVFQKIGKGFVNFMTGTIEGTPEKAMEKIKGHLPTKLFYNELDDFKKEKLVEYFAADLTAGTPGWSEEKQKFVDKNSINKSITH
jgi:hypothetical protein